MTNSIASYFSQLNKETSFIVQERPVTEFHNQIEEAQYKMNNNWAEPVFRQSKYVFTFNKMQRKNPEPEPLYTDFSPQEKDLTKNKGKLSEKKIHNLNMLNTYTKPKPVPLITESFPNKTIDKISHFPEIPQNYYKPKNGYLSLSIGKCSIDEKLNINMVGGFFQLFDFKNQKPLSEPVNFRVSDGYAIFVQTIAETVHFPIHQIGSSVTLLCVTIQEKKGHYYPLAHSVIKLYDDKGNFEFSGGLINWVNLKEWSFKNFTQSSSDAPRTVLPINFQINLHYNTDLKYEFTYSWSKQPCNYHMVTSLPTVSYLPTPLIIISGIKISKKFSKRITNIYLNLMISEGECNFKITSGSNVFLHDNPTNLYSSIKSLSYATAETVDFIDYFFAYVDHQFSKNSHILIQIMGIDKDPNKADTLLGTTVIPLYQKTISSFKSIKYKIFDPKKQPKEIFKDSYAKETSKSYLQCDVHLPSAYFPPSPLKSVIKAILPEQALPPSITQIPKHLYNQQIIPVTAKLLKLVDQNTIIHLMQFFDNFDPNFVRTILRFWIFHVMDVNLFGPNFIDKICKSTSQIMKNNQENFDASQENIRYYLKQITFTLPIIFDILLVSISLPDSTFSKPDLIEFLKLIPRIIGRCCNRSYQEDSCSERTRAVSFRVSSPSKMESPKPPQNAITLNESLANFICMLMPKYLLFKDVNNLIFEYLDTMKKMKKYASFKIYFTYLQFDFLLPFAGNQFYFANLALSVKSFPNNIEIVPFLPVMSLIYNAFYQSLDNTKKNKEKTLEIEIDFLFQLVVTFENAPDEINKKLAYILQPLIDLFLLPFNTQITREMQTKLIPVILFIFSKSESSQILKMFSTCGNSYQLHYLKLLNSMINTTNKSLEEVKPTYNKPHLLLTYYDLLTKNILNILLIWINNLGQHLSYVVLILKNLYNKFQPKDNIKQFYNFCVQIAQKYPCQRELVTWALSLLTFTQHNTRCFGASLLISIFKCDFDHTGTVIISSVDMMDSLTSILLNLRLEEIPIYKLLLGCIKNILNKYFVNINPTFVRLLQGRIYAAKTISDIVETQKKSDLPPDTKCQNLMIIADQYKTIPSMRLKWLKQIVNVNQEFEHYTSAFITQLHIVTLIESVIQEINHIPSTNYKKLHQLIVQPLKNSIQNAQYQYPLDVKNDFSFVPSVLNEAKIEFKNLIEDESAQILLSDFTIDLLMDELQRAIQIGEKAFMFYSLRPLYSLQLRLNQSTRNFSKMSETMKNLGESIGKIQTKSSKDYDLPISFYLVEENGTKTQEIFVISNYKSAEHAFIPLLNRYNCFNGKTINVCKKHSEKCDKETVCIVHLTPVIENDTRTQEFPHTWYKFRTIPTAIDNDNKYQYVEYLTNEALPRYKWSSKVKSSKTVIMTENEYVTQKYNKTIELLNKTADEFEIWFPYPDNHQNKAIKPKEGLFTLDIHRISDVLSSNLKGTDSFVSLLSKFKETNEKDAMKMANGVRTAAIRCVNVYRRAVENLQTKQAYEQLLPFLETMVGDFTEQFGLEPMEKESYSCLDDPMEDGIEFSE